MEQKWQVLYGVSTKGQWNNKRYITPVYVDQENKVLQISRIQPTEAIRIFFTTRL